MVFEPEFRLAGTAEPMGIQPHILRLGQGPGYMVIGGDKEEGAVFRKELFGVGEVLAC